MKDTSVSPPGLFSLSRSRRLLSSLESRSRQWAEQLVQIEQQHAVDESAELAEHERQRQTQAESCRLQRREMLTQWDVSEEKLISHYESTTVGVRQDLNRLAAIYRRKVADERKSIEQKVAARRQAVLQQYESEKNQPGIKRKKEFNAIDAALVPLQETITAGRELTIQRLEQLPDVDGTAAEEEEFPEPKIHTVAESIAAIESFTEASNAILKQMRSGIASKMFLFPLGAILFMAIWAVAAYVFTPYPPWLMMGAGVPIASVIALVAYIVKLLPLKRLTRQLYPKLERIELLSDACSEAGHRISKRIASEASAELIQRRDSHLDAAHRWEVDHLAEMEARLTREEREAREKLTKHMATIDRKFTTEIDDCSGTMRTQADKVAESITQQIATNERLIAESSAAAKTKRHHELSRFRERLQKGIRSGFNRILLSHEIVQQRFPEWSVVAEDAQPAESRVDFVPIGELRVKEYLHRVNEMKFRQNVDAEVSGAPSDTPSQPVPESLPIVLHRRLNCGLVIHCPSAKLNAAIDVVHQILWRMLTGAKPGRVKLTLIDPLGRGQHFTSFMALGDHDPSIVSHRVWTEESKIEARLEDLAHHVEDILQTCLRDRFARIEDYNEVAGSMAEPYRVVAAIGLPEGLSRDGYKHLRALLESGARCGIITLLVCDEAKPWPTDMPLPSQNHMLSLRIDNAGVWSLDGNFASDFEFVPAGSPPVSMRDMLSQTIGKAAAAAAKVEIPLASILAPSSDGAERTDVGIHIPIGSQGANRTLAMDLGEGVRQHTLIAGKTGSGKSTLLHAIITAGMHQYRPSELQYYLLDFKKGVEFKLYADSDLASMRVIGIESEREFGRSVLQRLDGELQQRGELFRGAAVQEISEYRRVTGKEMPRLMLVVDEFQELFLRDDRLASDCAMLLDRLVRQGRSFGMHVVLSSQSLAGAYSLPRATLGQMAVRIAMQCSESDAAMILADDNTAARLLSRPGEAIYNDAGGLVEGNQPFQVAWLSSDSHREMLGAISTRDQDSRTLYPPTVVFEGNRPAKWTTGLVDAATKATQSDGSLRGLLGEAVEIGPPVTLELSRNAGRNMLLVGVVENRPALLASMISCMAKGHADLKVAYFDGARVDDPPSLAPWLSEAGIQVETVKPRDCETKLKELVELVSGRGDVDEEVEPIVVVIDPLDRFRDLRQDDSFNFSLDSASNVSAASLLQTLLRDGPSARVFTILACNNTETLSRWLPRASQHDLELRVLGVLNASDSSMLIDTPAAAELSAATMLVYDDADGKLTKFRFVNMPSAEAVRSWLS